MTTARRQRFTIASNQGTIGGGEVMLLQIAEAARELGRDVTVVGPADPGELCGEAETRGFHTVRIQGRSTAAYLRNLRTWDRRYRRGLLWCNGLRPAFATAGHRRRVVHLHQQPLGKLRKLSRIARTRSLLTVVPSQAMASAVDGSTVLPNWSPALRASRPEAGAITTIGFLGRLSTDKGVDVLADAFRLIAATRPQLRLLLAGDTRFVDPSVQKRIDAAITSLGDTVDTPGWMDREEFFSTVNLAVFPSVWQEAFGLVATEAMSVRCPLVVSDAGALPEVVGPDFPFIAPAGDSGALAHTIERALDTKVESVLDASYDRWSRLYSPEAGIRALGALLEEIDPVLEENRR